MVATEASRLQLPLSDHYLDIVSADTYSREHEKESPQLSDSLQGRGTSILGRIAVVTGAAAAGFTVAAVIYDGKPSLIGGAVVSLLLTVALAILEAQERKRESRTESEPGSQVSIDGDANNANIAGRDQVINYAPPAAKPVVMDGWEEEPGAPEFRMSQASNGSTRGVVIQNIDFWQMNETPVGALRARLRGPGWAGEMAPPMSDNRPRRYQVKPATFTVDQEPDSELGLGMVGFEIQFNWEGAERHILWTAPLQEIETKPNQWHVGWQQQPARYWSALRGS